MSLIENSDANLELLYRIDDSDLENIRLVNHLFHTLTRRKDFWRGKAERRFGRRVIDFKLDDETYCDQYLLLVADEPHGFKAKRLDSIYLSMKHLHDIGLMRIVNPDGVSSVEWGTEEFKEYYGSPPWT